MSGPQSAGDKPVTASELVETGWDLAERGNYFGAAECFEAAARIMRQKGLNRVLAEAQAIERRGAK